MNEEIYQVSRDEYAGLIGEMKTDCFDMEKDYQNNCTIIKLISKNTNHVITKRIIPEEGEEIYFIYELPEDNERLAPKRIRKYELQSKEEVQTFFNILNQIQRGDRHD